VRLADRDKQNLPRDCPPPPQILQRPAAGRPGRPGIRRKRASRGCGCPLAAEDQRGLRMYNSVMDRPNDMQPARAEPIRFTYEDYLGFPDDGRRHELVEGEHVVTPAPTRRHQELAVRLLLALGNYLQAHPIGHLYPAPIDVILSDTDVVQPDIVYVSHERSQVLGTWIHGAPDLAVEIVSPSSRRNDEVLKRRLFDRFDVREYWVVDPEVESVKVYRRSEAGTFPRAAELSREEGHTLESPLLPGLTIALRDLFA
jgi:Uma2 family endonuclease